MLIENFFTKSVYKRNIRLSCSKVQSCSPEVSFKRVANDFCKISDFSYLTYVEVCSGWIAYFATFVVPEEIGSDGGPPFDFRVYVNFLTQWNIRRRLSFAYYSQSNGREEVSVQTANRIFLGSVDPLTGKPNNDKAARALTTHQNPPCQQTGILPAVALFGRPIRDHLPFQRNRPTKWNNTSFVTEVLPRRQYRVVVDGSRWVTLHKQQFLRKILSVCRQTEDLAFKPLLTKQPTPSTYTSNTDLETTTPGEPAAPQESEPSSPSAVH